ncbi:sodium/panthothenate symporter [Psittacicella melopsittaci]|uniref:Sodium/panthothenate symporter n=1 Tax=Psittacicella melopsittaci TaxID=2028576 RepID=A0A3A1Y1L6_9GAMM|nr:sodium/pantothenate symporter [Psittacicella melopsittaci]RIY31176.1 sodium/panthothenate symporter [Psittacicella melopsittaci]
MNHLAILTPIIIYFISLIAFNLFVKYKDIKALKGKKVNFIKNYSLSDRKMTALALAMGSASTYASASSFIGGPGTAYYYGLGWVVIALIQVPTMWFVFTVLGNRINKFANEHGCSTVNEVLLARYKSPFLVNLTSLILVLCFIASIVVQFIGAARLLEGTLNIEYKTALFSFVSVITFYTFFGNFKTVSYSDILQGSIMFLGSLFLIYFTLSYVGGFEQVINNIKQTDAKLLDPFNGVITPQLYFSFWVLVCFGILGLPQTVIRTMSSQSPKERLKAIIIATVVLYVILIAMHLAGFFANGIIPRDTISSPDLVIPKLITIVMHPILGAIFLIAPMAAILSTIDSMLIQCTSTLVNDLYLNNKNRYFPTPELTDNEYRRAQNKVRIIVRSTTFLIIILAVTFSINPPNILIWLNLLSFGGLQATFLWPIVLGLFVKSINKYSSIASVVVGIGTYAILTFTKFSIFGFHQIVPSLLFSLIAVLLVQLFTSKIKV